MKKIRKIHKKIIRFISKLIHRKRYLVTFERIIQENTFYKDKLVSKVKRHVWAKSYTDAYNKIRGKKHKYYGVQNIKVTEGDRY